VIFEALPTTPRSDELIDQAFSRAARAGRAKDGREAQESMLQTASNVLSDNVENVVTAWPDFDAIDPFYYDLANAVLGGIDGFDPERSDADAEDPVGVLRGYLAELRWVGNKTHEIGREYQGKVRATDADTGRKLRKQAFARMADVIEQVETELEYVGAARDELRRLPDIRPDEPTIVVAGYPNVGKSSLVNAVTRASNEIAEYPFTTRGINVGHLERDHVRYQLVDTPGLLDRPEAERNDIEEQAVSALVHAADAVVVLVDASETCGYQLDAQLALRDAVAERFSVPVLTVCNKADLSTAVEADAYTSVTAEEEVAGRKSADAGNHVESLESVLDRTIEAVGHEPELPFEEG
jgi:nucleolar GTP-binding protein